MTVSFGSWIFPALLTLVIIMKYQFEEWGGEYRHNRWWVTGTWSGWAWFIWALLR